MRRVPRRNLQGLPSAVPLKDAGTCDFHADTITSCNGRAGNVMKIALEGKNAIVAGGSRGIGRAIADAFAQAGANVAVCARDTNGLKTAEAELRRHGGVVFGIACDLGDPTAVGHFVKDAGTALGGINILVNNASGLALG